MRDADWERVVDASTVIEGIADDYSDDDRRCRLRGEVEDIITRFECRSDLAARALVALASAWLSSIDVEEEEQRWRDSFRDDDDDHEIASSGAAPAAVVP
jgi:hypothetical protein